MYLPRRLRKKIDGQTLIEILIGIAIFSILANAVFTLVSSSYRFTSFNRARITARHLAQEKMELIRNLPYGDVGTVGGIPDGPLPQDETVSRNGLNFIVETDIIYVDDIFDQQAPTDLLPTDYKRVRIEVSWEGLAASRKNPVILVTDIVPKGIETIAGGGTLSILVFDASAQPVSQADVTIIANSITPPVNLTLQTGSNGRIILPGAPICTACYQVTVTKSGYSQERTYSTSEVANPSKPHLTIFEGDLTQVSFSIDLISTINISSVTDRDGGFATLPSVPFEMMGEKTIGTDTGGTPVYKYNQSLIIDSSGNLNLTNMEWDNYNIAMPNPTSWDISGSNPLLPLIVQPNLTVNFTFALSSHTTNNLLTTFVNSSQQQIASVSATLSDGGAYNETKLSGNSGNPDFGQVFFSGLTPTTYTIVATASGFLDFSGSIPVLNQTYETIILEPQ